jgi:Na+/proline symporter
MEVVMAEKNLNHIRGAALDRIEKSERQFKWALVVAALFEGLFLVTLLLAMERGNRTHLLLVIATIGSYTVIVLGLIVLGTYVNRCTARVLKAIETVGEK